MIEGACEEGAEVMRILMELRPALDGFSGIPQETRLLFAHLNNPEMGLEVDGLINSPDASYRLRRRSNQKLIDIYRQGQYILSISKPPLPPPNSRLLRYFKYLSRSSRLIRLTTQALLGSRSTLVPFDGHWFSDFIWQQLFAKTLTPDMFNNITDRCYYASSLGWGEMHRIGMISGYYPRINTDRWDIALMQTPFPGHVSANTKMIIRYHDAIPLLLPQHISNAKVHSGTHYNALRTNAKLSWFVCTSPPVRDDLIGLFPKLEERVFVIPDIVSEAYFPDRSARTGKLGELLRRFAAGETKPNFQRSSEEDRFYNKLEDDKYIIAVATVEPRKNFLRLIAAWEDLYLRTDGAVKLVIVGSLGWDYASEHDKMREWAKRGALFHLQRVPIQFLRRLYSDAVAVVCPSVAEGFDYSGIEAMRCGAAVIASDIGAHRAIYGEAALYFDPYSTRDLYDQLERTCAESWSNLKMELNKCGTVVAAQYTKDAIISQWHNMLNSICTTRAPRVTEIARSRFSEQIFRIDK